MGSSEPFTEFGAIGIEEEFFVVDAEGRPTSGTDELVYENDPPTVLDGRLDHELFKFVVETQTPKLSGPDEVDDAVRAAREALVEHADDHGFRVAAAGLHPGARWRELEHADKPRYRAQLDRIHYPQWRNTTAGLHVHVSVDDADKAIWIANELRWYLPMVLAVSVNSPFWNGFDTGLQSARAKVFEALPNTGMPTTFDSFEEFRRFERLMLETGSINDRGELWWDVRPHTENGTVEVRTPDTQTDPANTVVFAEYVHALVTDLGDRFEDGETGYRHRRELLDENKWRALRYGHEASFISRDGDGVVGLGEFVECESDRLDVPGLERLYREESGAERQRRVLAEEGPDALFESLVL